MQGVFPSNSIYSKILPTPIHTLCVSLKIGTKTQVSYIIIMLTQTILNCYTSLYGQSSFYTQLDITHPPTSGGLPRSGMLTIREGVTQVILIVHGWADLHVNNCYLSLGLPRIRP